MPLGDVLTDQEYYVEEEPKPTDPWRVKSDWLKEDLYLELITSRDTKEVRKDRTKIHLSQADTPWLISSPIVSIGPILYAINDGPSRVLDMRNVYETGIQAEPGDTLTIQEVWCHFDDHVGKEQFILKLVAYLTTDEMGYDGEYLHTSSKSLLRRGIHPLSGFAPMDWEIPADRDLLVLWLRRDDGVIISGAEIPLKPDGNQGLVVDNNIIHWPFQNAESINAEYIDFEKISEIKEWREEVEEEENSLIGQTSNEAFSGEYAMAVPVSKDSENTFVTWKHQIKAELIIGHVFWPEKKGVSIDWAITCIGIMGECVFIPTREGQWNTFVFDLSQFRYNGQSLNTMEHSKIWLRGKISGDVDKQNPYTFYMDGIQLFSLQE